MCFCGGSLCCSGLALAACARLVPAAVSVGGRWPTKTKRIATVREHEDGPVARARDRGVDTTSIASAHAVVERTVTVVRARMRAARPPRASARPSARP